MDNGLRLCAHAHPYLRRCASAHTESAYRPADNQESLPTRHCIAEQNYTYIVSHVNERSALTLLSSLRIVLRSRHGPPARLLYPRRDLRISYFDDIDILSSFFDHQVKKKPLFFIAFMLKRPFHTVSGEVNWKYRGRFMSCKIGTRKNKHGCARLSRSNERNIPSRTFLITSRKTQQVRGNVLYTSGLPRSSMRNSHFWRAGALFSEQEWPPPSIYGYNQRYFVTKQFSRGTLWAPVAPHRILPRK